MLLLASNIKTQPPPIPVPELLVAQDAMEAAQFFAGEGVTIHSANFLGDINQLARFKNGQATIGFEQGIALTTGNASFAGTRACSDCQQSVPDNNIIDDDPDIDVITNFGQYNPAALEFTFSSKTKNIEFEFVFASTEYPTYVNSNFNDLFALILSGPGINGPFTDNGENIAIVPKPPFDVPISINTINNGNAIEPATNPDLFIANYPKVLPYNQYWVYDGQTVVLKIDQEIECNVIYKLRLVIANIYDTNRDSGVFFKKGSLKSPFNLGELSINPVPVCEGNPIILSVVGDPTYTYNWSTGQSGVGLNSITTVSSTTITQYSVEAVSTENCVIGEVFSDAVVHSINNIPPFMNGINNTGIYNTYVRAGEFLEFQVPTFDSPNEGVEFIWLPPPIGNQSFDGSPLKNIGNFDWTPQYNELGNYSINAFCVDDNVCGNLQSDVYTFNINVICPYCEVGVEYSNRYPNNNPVPPITEAASYIVAGINGPVVIDQPTIFRAGEYIISEVEFVSGGELIQEIVPVCSEDVCDECCESENIDMPELFTPQIFTPDGDNNNDIWYISDLNNPYCAFNAISATLNIFDRFGVKVFTRTVNGSDCCPFKSAPALGYEVLNPLRWDGTCNISGLQTPPVGSIMIHGDYFYEYTLSTCSGLMTGSGNVTLLGGSARYASQVDSNVIPEPLNNKNDDNFEFLVYPNPSEDLVNISLLNYHSEDNNFSIQIHDLSGRLINQIAFTQKELKLDVNQYESGCYIISLVCIENKIIAVQKLIVR